MGTEASHTIAFIPARGGSKSIPRKNIKALAGRPLLHWVLDAAAGCDSIDRVCVATDDVEIADCVRAHGSDKVEAVPRSAETASDTATTEAAMLEFARDRAFECMVLIQATSPLLRREQLVEAIRHYRSSGSDSLVSVVRQKRFMWTRADGKALPVNYDPRQRPRRQDFDGYYVENGAFYITSRESLLASGCRLSGKMTLYEMPEETYFELDEPGDWEIVEGLLRNRERLAGAPGDSKPEIRLVATDVDGVLTDAGMYYSESGDEQKKFNTRDGKAFELLRQQGIQTAIITSENTKLVERRARKLKIDHLLQGVEDKASALTDLCQTLGIELRNVAYMGDDLNDLEVLRIVGCAACPADAVAAIQSVVQHVCSRRGGEGCLRELVDVILRSRSGRSFPVH
jgi:YrbI family 3-deoxy-D-manno-octulosonate 8-phosphate phosphatase